MSNFNAKTICVLGRQPALGLAELESLYGAERLKPLASGFALLDIEPEAVNFKRLGGVIKTARVLSTLPYADWESVGKYLRENIPEHVKNVPDGKFTLGVSVYNLNVKPDWINKNNLAIKKQIKASGRPVRIVPNKNLELNSAQVLHNKLTHRGAWELLLIGDGQQTIVAQTLFVQDIDAYAARDQARPKRDARVGMLPPKLAQIIVNLGAGGLEQKPDIAEQRGRVRLLDPFCGTGVILQEAMLMGYSVIGTDIEPRMVDYTKQNLKWLIAKYPELENYAEVEEADAISGEWPGFSIVASEVFLGRPLAVMPAEADLKQIISDANTIIKKFLNNIAPQMRTGQRICLAVPAWQKADENFVQLPLLAKITEMGYNYLDLKHVRRNELLYYRPDQIVARQLVVLEKA